MTSGDVLDHIGVYAFAWGAQPPAIGDAIKVAIIADDLGFDSVHVPWHFTLSEKSFSWGNRRTIDPLVLLPTWIAHTQRVKVALDPWPPSLMHPYFWAQFLSSLHYMSGGRTMTGVREAWWEEDYLVAQADRVGAEERFDRCLEIVTRLWAGETLNGSDIPEWELGDIALDPGPGAPIPLWINGRAEEDIRRAARWGDTLRPLFANVDEIRPLRDQLSAASAAFNRHVSLADSTICTVILPTDSSSWVDSQVHAALERRLHGREVGDSLIIGSPQQCAERLSALAEAGIDYFLLDTQFHGWQTPEFSAEQLRRFVEHVVPLVDWADRP
ncbi:MAG: LLM class flavin-dependent oxidoreductase [Nostocoides sp.]